MQIQSNPHPSTIAFDLPTPRVSTPQNPNPYANETSTPIDALLTKMTDRGIKNFHVPGGVMRAAKELAKANRVAILSGFNVEKGMGETDGPVGAAALFMALRHLGINAMLVYDQTNTGIGRATLGVLNEEAGHVRIVTHNAPHEQKTAAANAFLDRYKPDAVVAIELPAPSADGQARNMRGLEINSFNPPLAEIVNVARDRGMLTVGVGDGGNEAGMGNVRHAIQLAKNDMPMASSVDVHYPVTSWNSNLGGEALAAVMLNDAGMLDKLHTPHQLAQMIQACMDAGAVDGVTRLGKPNVSHPDNPTAKSGVDGFAPAHHQGVLADLIKLVAAHKPSYVPRGLPNDGRPYVVMGFDSSHGGIIAANDIAKFVNQRSNHQIRFVVLGDHANAPYGDHGHDKLVQLVTKGLLTADQINEFQLEGQAGAHQAERPEHGPNVHDTVMICNTACTAQEEAEKSGIHAKAINLIETTAHAMKDFGGENIALFATPATVKSKAYQNRIQELTGQQAKAIGPQAWAPLVNRMAHESTDTATRQEVADSIADHVAQLPANASTVWLCCTHYPALKGGIEADLKANGRGDLPVINPMEYQADRLIGNLDALQAKVDNGQLDLSHVKRSQNPIVLTTGEVGTGTDMDVKPGARQILGTKFGAENVSVIHCAFGRDFDVGLVADLLYERPPQGAPVPAGLAQLGAGPSGEAGESSQAKRQRTDSPQASPSRREPAEAHG